MKHSYERTGKRPGSRISLRVRMTLLVSAELVVSVLIALGLFALLKPHFPMDSGKLLFLILLLIGLLIGSLVTAFLSKLFFDPIKKVRRAMEQVAQGDFSVRLPEKSSSEEILDIYTGFNLMAHELAATEILQTDFVNNVCHEFKTPISAIEGYSMLLQDGENLTDEQRQYVQKVLFNTKRLSSLMGSILLLSKLENQQIPSTGSTYRLDEQIRQSIVALEPVWDRKNIEFDAELEELHYTGSEAMMRHVWDNLISNAVKFTPNGGTVRISLHGGHPIVCTVEDEGPGLSEQAQKHLFDKFYQADTSHKQEGNGLGLTLVKKILTMEGAEIRAENVTGGCRFTVTLYEKDQKSNIS